jgi:gas vesicle protein
MHEPLISDNTAATGHGFTYGLIFGAAIGAAVALLFAPKPGSELRGQLGGQIADATTKFRRRANEVYQQATSMADDLSDRARNSVP